ncbi:CHAT domain-containing protein [Streptomyces microflavus]|uniref:CHAT domain-containing protein n=1 Tax=Streptomyces microflavus TaxID=1919 RepID=UPI00386AA316|nr:CHAT domain-containing protein [Streptomyces microflavus]WST12739.1 CHAT domain-containing protein [Streptomyces microflavus]
MRTVVAFEQRGTRTLVKLAASPISIADAGELKYTELPVVPDGRPVSLAEYGESLRALLAEHRPVAKGLENAFAQQIGTDSPLYFHMVSTPADAVPWEHLHNGQGFCALDRWPIGRIARIAQDVDHHGFLPPVRIVAVLSAAQRDGSAQLDGLLRAVRTPDARELGVHLHIISAQRGLLTAARAAEEEEAPLRAAGEGDRPVITVQELPGTEPDLTRCIATARPHILHLLGHGGVRAGEPVFSFVTAADQAAEMAGESAGTGSLVLSVQNLAGILKPCAPWLVILGACRTAAATQRRSLAHELVSLGIPAAVGMRRNVGLGVADQFCRAFYPEVVSLIATAIRSGRVQTIDWAAALTPPRKVLAGSDPEQADEWTDPVLYVQHSPFLVIPGSPDKVELVGYLRFWVEYRDSLPDTADPRVMAYVETRIAWARALVDPGTS